MENRNILLTGFDLGVKDESSQGIHDLGDIDVIRASNTTGITGGADPNRLRRENLFSMVVLDMTENLIGEDIHGISDRTPCRTLLALVTGLDFFTAYLNHLR
jgi:hypothetical protein